MAIESVALPAEKISGSVSNVQLIQHYRTVGNWFQSVV